jgi:hypothetical protein
LFGGVYYTFASARHPLFTQCHLYSIRGPSDR